MSAQREATVVAEFNLSTTSFRSSASRPTGLLYGAYDITGRADRCEVSLHETGLQTDPFHPRTTTRIAYVARDDGTGVAFTRIAFGMEKRFKSNKTFLNR